MNKIKTAIFSASVLVFLLFAGCSVGEKERKIGDINDLPENGIITGETLESLKDDNAVAVFRGSSNGISYEWTLFGSEISYANDIDLSVEIIESVNEDHVTLKLGNNEQNAPVPVLALKMPDKWSVNRAYVQRLKGEACESIGSVSVTGSDTTVFSFTPEGMNGEYRITTEKPQTTNGKTEQGIEALKKNEMQCTVSIECSTVFSHLSELQEGKINIIPANGKIIDASTVTFVDGETVFDVLQRICKEKKIHLEASETPMYNSSYIEGIGNLYENDCGSLSGWVYSVNDEFPDFSCSKYILKSGDIVEWRYTCELGRDVGSSGLNS